MDNDENEGRTWTKILKLNNEKCLTACSVCDRKTNHQILSNIKKSYQDPDNSIEDLYQTIQCCGCEQLGFRVVEYDYGNVCGNEPLQPHNIALYPPRSIRKLRLNDDELYLLPPNIRKLFNEVYSVISNDCRILAVMGIRCLLEAICQDKQAEGDNLQKKIANLESLCLIRPSDSQILSELRERGNEAAHEIKFFDEEVIHSAFGIIQHLLQSIYIIKHNAEKLTFASNHRLSHRKKGSQGDFSSLDGVLGGEAP